MSLFKEVLIGRQSLCDVPKWIFEKFYNMMIKILVLGIISTSGYQHLEIVFQTAVLQHILCNVALLLLFLPFTRTMSLFLPIINESNSKKINEELVFVFRIEVIVLVVVLLPN